MRWFNFWVGLAVMLLITPLIWVIIYASGGANGVVVDKYYDDSDLVCTKGCVRTSDCWTIDTGGSWLRDGKSCVSKARYDSIEIGDTYP